MQDYVDAQMQFPRETLFVRPCSIPVSIGRATFLNASRPLGHTANWQFKSSYDAICPNHFYLHLKQYGLSNKIPHANK